MTDQIPAAWYPDPDDDGISERWWDGHDWTDHTRPSLVVPPRPRPVPPAPAYTPQFSPPPPATSYGPPQGQAPFTPRQQPKGGAPRWVWIAGAIVVIAIIGGAIGSHSSTNTDASVTAQEPSADVPTTPAAVATSSSPPAAKPRAVKPTAIPAPAAARYAMPNEVGQVLQDAQDDLQRVFDSPLYYSTSSDASGRRRHQILDRDWRVCSQNVVPGTAIDPDEIIVSFAVVRVTETCP